MYDVPPPHPGASQMFRLVPGAVPEFNVSVVDALLAQIHPQK